MKLMAMRCLMFVVLFIFGVYVIGDFMPKDDANLTIPYTEEIEVYVPPNTNIVEKFDAGSMSLSTIDMAGYKQFSLSEGSQNFMVTSLLDEGG